MNYGIRSRAITIPRHEVIAAIDSVAVSATTVRSEKGMTGNILEAQWRQLKARAGQKWHKLTDEELVQISVQRTGRFDPARVWMLAGGSYSAAGD